jgi:glycine cleavage system H lipoate-binding protein
MKAGVVNFRHCDNAYDCFTCPFDRGMRKAMGLDNEANEKEARPGWVEYLKKSYAGSERPCRHTLTGHVDAPKICTLNYECYHCPYDQMLDESDFGQLGKKPHCELVSGYRMAHGYYYHRGHTWARFDHGGRIRIGFDDFLVRLFGAVQELRLPPLGAELLQDQVGWSFGRDNQRAAVLAPVSGTVLAVNHRALEHPEITHHDPYQVGWLFVLEPDLPKRNLKRLYYEREGFQWMEMESQKLLALLGPEYEQLAATGGEALKDFYGGFPHLGWDKLVRTFLQTETI